MSFVSSIAGRVVVTIDSSKIEEWNSRSWGGGVKREETREEEERMNERKKDDKRRKMK